MEEGGTIQINRGHFSLVISTFPLKALLISRYPSCSLPLITVIEFGRSPLHLTLEDLPGVTEVTLGPLKSPQELEDPKILREWKGREGGSTRGE